MAGLAQLSTVGNENVSLRVPRPNSPFKVDPSTGTFVRINFFSSLESGVRAFCDHPLNEPAPTEVICHLPSQITFFVVQVLSETALLASQTVLPSSAQEGMFPPRPSIDVSVSRTAPGSSALNIRISAQGGLVTMDELKRQREEQEALNQIEYDRYLAAQQQHYLPSQELRVAQVYHPSGATIGDSHEVGDSGSSVERRAEPRRPLFSTLRTLASRTWHLFASALSSSRI